MNADITSKLTAYVDGELSAEEGAEVEAMAAENPEVSEELDALRQNRKILQSAPAPKHDAEAAWQNFSKNLATAEADHFAKPAGSPIPFPTRWGAIAALAAIAAVIWFALPSAQEEPQLAQDSVDLSETVELVQTDIEDSEPIVYIDSESGWTIVWIETPDSPLEPAG